MILCLPVHLNPFTVRSPLVRPILKYGSVALDSHCADMCHRLEIVQMKFLNYYASYT